MHRVCVIWVCVFALGQFVESCPFMILIDLEVVLCIRSDSSNGYTLTISVDVDVLNVCTQ